MVSFGLRKWGVLFGHFSSRIFAASGTWFVNGAISARQTCAVYKHSLPNLAACRLIVYIVCRHMLLALYGHLLEFTWAYFMYFMGIHCPYAAQHFVGSQC